jgi:hypothetical protein
MYSGIPKLPVILVAMILSTTAKTWVIEGVTKKYNCAKLCMYICKTPEKTSTYIWVCHFLVFASISQYLFFIRTHVDGYTMCHAHTRSFTCLKCVFANCKDSKVRGAGAESWCDLTRRRRRRRNFREEDEKLSKGAAFFRNFERQNVEIQIVRRLTLKCM